MLELFIGVIATCVPCLKLPADRLLSKMGFQLSSKTYTNKISQSSAYVMSQKNGLTSQLRANSQTIRAEDAVWDGALSTIDSKATRAVTLSQSDKGGIFKDTHTTWETSSG
jgi:hypothetical protein